MSELPEQLQQVLQDAVLKLEGPRWGKVIWFHKLGFGMFWTKNFDLLILVDRCWIHGMYKITIQKSQKILYIKIHNIPHHSHSICVNSQICHESHVHGCTSTPSFPTCATSNLRSTGRNFWIVWMPGSAALKLHADTSNRRRPLHRGG